MQRLAICWPHADTFLMSIEQRVRHNGGIMRTADLYELGASNYQLAALAAAGRLIRPRRGWVSLPGISAERLLALQHSAVVSCVSAAELLGLWVLEPRGIHLAARARSRGCTDKVARLHYGRPVVQRDPAAIIDPIENVLGYVATCLSYREARIVWESALNKKLVRLDQLRQLPYKGAAKRLLQECSPFSDSGLETMVKGDLRWIREPIRSQVMLLGHRVDFLIGERLVFQIDGGHHVGPQRTSDITHDAELTLAGYHVIRVGYTQVVNGWPEIQHRIALAIAEGLHRAK